MLQDNVAPGVTGKIMGVPPARHDPSRLRLRHPRSLLRHDFPERVKADENYQSPALPVTVQHLRDEGLSQAFITYMSGWKGFVAEEGA